MTQTGTIISIKSFVHEGTSSCEILIQSIDGRRLSTGRRSAAEIKPYFWREGDLVSFDITEGEVTNIIKVASAPNDVVLNARSGVTSTQQERTLEAVLKNYVWYVGVVLIAVAYWISKGTPNPALFFAGSAAKEECLRLAEENKGSMFLIGNGELEANNTWIKDGKRVVQLIQESSGGMSQIMCLYGNGMVSIPSALEQGRWQ